MPGSECVASDGDAGAEHCKSPASNGWVGGDRHVIRCGLNCPLPSLWKRNIQMKYKSCM